MAAPDKDDSTPRVFLIRHGQTEWSISGRHTGTTDIPLTPHGENQVKATAEHVYGKGKLIDPSRVAKVWTSPRTRAIKTYELLSGGSTEYEVVQGLAEWDYGEYEGLKTAEIKAKRKEKGLDTERDWDVWRDGCEGGESPQQLTERIDAIITNIKDFQKDHMTDGHPKDIVIIAHGHLTRAFAKRWLGLELAFPLGLMMDPGGVATLSYQHHKIEEPALLLGIKFPLKKD